MTCAGQLKKQLCWSEYLYCLPPIENNEDLCQLMKEMLKQLLQKIMQVELKGLIQTTPYPRSPSRSVLYYRNLATKFGLRWNLEVFCLRKGMPLLLIIYIS